MAGPRFLRVGKFYCEQKIRDPAPRSNEKITTDGPVDISKSEESATGKVEYKYLPTLNHKNGAWMNAYDFAKIL